MPRGTRKKNTTKVSKRSAIPAASLISYKGRVDLPLNDTGITANLHETVSIASSGGGGISYIDTYSPSSADNWSEYSTSWLEYRVLGIKYHYMPQYKVNTATTTTVIQDTPVVFTTLHSVNTPVPTTISEAWAYSNNGKVDSLMREKSVTWKMNDAFEAQFESTVSPNSSIYTVMFWGSGASNSITYGTIFITYLVQFRNTRK